MPMCATTMSIGSRPRRYLRRAWRQRHRHAIRHLHLSRFDDRTSRAAFGIALDCWREVAEHASGGGLTYLFWEPMSVGREFGTPSRAARLQGAIDAAGMAIPLEMMVDIDHGDVTSSNPADIDPYAWAEAFPRKSPIIHIKQAR